MSIISSECGCGHLSSEQNGIGVAHVFSWEVTSYHTTFAWLQVDKAVGVDTLLFPAEVPVVST